MFQPRYTRVRPPRSEPVKVQILGPRFLEVLHARDLSRSGLAIPAPGNDPICALDARVRLLLTLPGERPFLVNGEVRHRTPFMEPETCGIEFVEIDECHRARIEAYVSRRLRDEQRARERASRSARGPRA